MDLDYNLYEDLEKMAGMADQARAIGSRARSGLQYLGTKTRAGAGAIGSRAKRLALGDNAMELNGLIRESKAMGLGGSELSKLVKERNRAVGKRLGIAGGAAAGAGAAGAAGGAYALRDRDEKEAYDYFDAYDLEKMAGIVDKARAMGIGLKDRGLAAGRSIKNIGSGKNYAKAKQHLADTAEIFGKEGKPFKDAVNYKRKELGKMVGLYGAPAAAAGAIGAGAGYAHNRHKRKIEKDAYSIFE